MSSNSNEIKKESNIVSKKEKVYIILFCAVSFASTLLILLLRLFTKWELVLRRPYTEAWAFFYWLLILAFVISLFFFEKREIIVLFLSSFIALFWEVLAEPFGWYFDLWPFAPHLDDPVEVFYLALLLGFEFYGGYYIFGMLYIKLYVSDFKYKSHLIVAMCMVLTVGGWLGDIHIARFDTYVITFFVWLILNSLHLMGVILLYKYIMRSQD